MSLYWILALAVTLLPCLTALPTPATQGNILFNDIKRFIEDLQKKGCSEADSKFYIPSGSDNCIIKALDCSILELEKVKTECFVRKSDARIVSPIKERITKMVELANSTLQGNPNNCFCAQENVEEKPLKEFLENIEKLLQMLNSRKYLTEA